MSNTKRWFDKPQACFRMGLDIGYKCRYCDNISHRYIVPAWKQYNPFWYQHENKQFRTEQHRKARHQNKILLRKGWEPDKIIQHTQGWGTN